jgi:phosphoribosyl-AMP cyclohydrolase
VILPKIVRAGATALAVFLTAAASAATLDWQGGTDDLLNPNYIDTTTLAANQSPGTGNVLNIGSLGTATYSSAGNTLSVSRLIVGHTVAPDTGVGTVLISDGTITTTGGASGAANGGVMIGVGASGTITMTGGTLTSNRVMTVGYANSTTIRATLNVGTGAFVSTTVGDLIIGGGSSSGARGDVTFAGSGSLSGNLTVGDQRGSTYTQTGGSLTVNGTVLAGRSNNSSSTLTISSGTLTAGAFTESDTPAVNANVVTINGDAWVETTFNTSGHNFTIGNGANSVGTVFNLDGNATIKSGNRFLMGSSNTVNDPTKNITVNQINGTNLFTRNISMGDAGGYATYNLSGGTLTGGNETSVIGRAGTGRFFQTGGLVSINNGINIGDRQSATTSLNNSGLYQISAGTLNTTSVGLSVGPLGAGTFNVVGGDAVINLTGNFSVAATGANNAGTLMFSLQPSESLSEIVASGNGTFGAGSHIVIDDGGNTPTQFVYDVLTAAAIAYDGLIFQAPSANWSYAIIPGGNGQILEVYSPEPGSLTVIGLSSFVLLRRRTRCA